MLKPFLPQVLALAVVVTAVGCGAASSGMSTSEPRKLDATQTSAHAKYISEGDALWAKRGQGGNAMAAIGKWEEAVKVQPGDWRTCAKLSKAYFFAAGGWLSNVFWKKRMKLHERGFELAEQGLKAQSPRFAKLRSQGSKIENAVEVIEREGIPLAYWYGTNLGAYAYASGMVDGLKLKSRIEKMIQHVHKTERPFFHYGADRFLAAFYGAAPPFIGGDINKATEQYEFLAKKVPNNLSMHYVKARYYAVRKKDKAMFLKLLNGIIAAKPCADPNPTTPCIEAGSEAEADLEKSKARALLPDVGIHF